MNRIQEGLAGILCHMDDVLVFGATQEQHDLNLMAVLKKLEATGVTLKPTKCEFSKTSEKFLGHLDKNGISADSNKTEAVLHMDAPQSVIDLRRVFFFGMVNQLGKFFVFVFFMSGPPESTIKEVTNPKKCLDMGSRARASILRQERTYLTHCASSM